MRDNSKIIVPKSERENILQIAHQINLGQEMMVHQILGKVFWAGMNSDIREMVAKCDPCQRYHRSYAKEKVEVSHALMFNIWAGHTIHMDLCQYKNINYLFCVDRLTGYIQVERVPNEQTSSAILGLKKWATKIGFPYKIFNDSGGGLRDDFIKQLEELGIVHKLCSAYHLASYSLAERTVQSLKSVLRKSADRLDELYLAEIAFAINSHVSQEGT